MVSGVRTGAARCVMGDWQAMNRRLAALAEKKLFFVGGAPRSGTTWLQQMLDAHPEVACRGEGLFLNHLAVPLEKVLTERAKVISGKNVELFAHTGGFPLPDQAAAEHLTGTAILLALDHYGVPDHCRAMGEKTPENVFHFPRLRALFPEAGFIAICRDPRDVLSSAWHFFGKRQGQEIGAFVRAALPSLQAGAQAMIAFADAHPACCRLVTYESLLADPRPVLADLFGLLGVATTPVLLDDIVARTAFARATGGRAAGQVRDGAFHRAGVAGGGRTTFGPIETAAILEVLGWMLPRFGWSA